MMESFISSAHNPKIKQLNLLQQKSSERKATGMFVVEGKREVLHCLEGGYDIDTCFYCPEFLGIGENTDIMLRLPDSVRRFEVSSEVYNRIAYRESTEGIVAEVRTPQKTLSDLSLGDNPLIIVLESVEKPGNLGAVLRSADAAGADALIVCDPLTDLYNPNLIRSSIGAIFTVPCVACTSKQCIDFLKSRGIQILSAQLQDSHLYYKYDMTRGTAIIMGTESTGLSDIWREAADAHIRIPMLGKMDSLNVSISAAILLYEAVRQRTE